MVFRFPVIFTRNFSYGFVPHFGWKGFPLIKGGYQGGYYRAARGVGGGTPMVPLFKVKQQLRQIIDLIRFTLGKSRDGI